MELSLDVQHREDVLEFAKARIDYDRLLDDAPDIPAISIKAFNLEFPIEKTSRMYAMVSVLS